MKEERILVIVESPNKNKFNNAKFIVRRFNNMLELKSILLELDIFIDNEYLDKYCELIENNKNTKREKFKTERHHIIPRYYYKHLGDELWNSSNKDANVNKDNLVNLVYKDHVLAHYYLCKCAKESWLKESMAFSFYSMTFYQKLTKGEIEENNILEKYQELYEEYRISLSRFQQGKKLSSETKEKIGKGNKGKNKGPKSEEHKLALKQARNLHSTTKGKKAIYNPMLSKVKFITNDELESYLKEGWVIGSKPLSEETKRKIGEANKIALKGKKHQKIQPDKSNSGLIGSPIICIETGMLFENIKEATKWLLQEKGILGKIKDCCSGLRDTTGGYHWKYIKGGD